MASIFTTSDKIKVKGPLQSFAFTPFYLQFVPGVCVETITSDDTLKSYGEYSNTNSILAISHIRNGPKKKKSNLDNTDRYFPLFRGMFEVPAKGDPVLLCTIGGKQYYLGPLNTANDVNFNEDNLWEPEIANSAGAGNTEQDSRLQRGESLNFVRTSHVRMAKPYNKLLDGEEAYNENHGDLMLEGRHGNSVRVGSRGESPYVFISNGRQRRFRTEGFADGTLISITSNGSLNQHFGGFGVAHDPADPKTVEIVDGFKLASDYVSDGLKEQPPKRYMGDLIKGMNNQDNDDFIYNYGSLEDANQVLISSDRIIFNSKIDDILLSSNKDIHIGSKENVGISTGKDFVVDSEKTYLGSPYIEGASHDQMVMGKKLQQVLKDIVGLFKEIKTPTMMGPQASLPLPSESSVITAIDGILSSKHFLDK